MTLCSTIPCIRRSAVKSLWRGNIQRVPRRRCFVAAWRTHAGEWTPAFVAAHFGLRSLGWRRYLDWGRKISSTLPPRSVTTRANVSPTNAHTRRLPEGSLGESRQSRWVADRGDPSSPAGPVGRGDRYRRIDQEPAPPGLGPYQNIGPKRAPGDPPLAHRSGIHFSDQLLILSWPLFGNSHLFWIIRSRLATRCLEMLFRRGKFSGTV